MANIDSMYIYRYALAMCQLGIASIGDMASYRLSPISKLRYLRHTESPKSPKSSIAIPRKRYKRYRQISHMPKNHFLKNGDISYTETHIGDIFNMPYFQISILPISPSLSAINTTIARHEFSRRQKSRNAYFGQTHILLFTAAYSPF